MALPVTLSPISNAVPLPRIGALVWDQLLVDELLARHPACSLPRPAPRCCHPAACQPRRCKNCHPCQASLLPAPACAAPAFNVRRPLALVVRASADDEDAPKKEKKPKKAIPSPVKRVMLAAARRMYNKSRKSACATRIKKVGRGLPDGGGCFPQCSVHGSFMYGLNHR